MAALKNGSAPLLEAFENRRSYYQLDKRSPIPDQQIEELVRKTILHTPSAFNSQSTRLVLLLKDEHDAFWEIVKTALKGIVKHDWEKTEQKLDGFKAAYGTVLFYEAPEPIQQLQGQFPTYHDKFPQWSEHTSAMHQYALWTILEAEGFGANLQHYNPLPDQPTAERWNLPVNWSLKAQLVFGGRTGGPAGEKKFEPVEERLFVHGKM